VCARKSLGDGSYTGRTDRRQRFPGALVNKVRSNDVPLNPVKLHPALDTGCTNSCTVSPHILTERVQFLTVPRESYVYDSNRGHCSNPRPGGFSNGCARMRRWR
jgi:hypothetical protein